ncbi:peptidoglycan editing factor PgeF [bacterium]|nr:MAG: peptidoglycan editing factor PgeF [bacterium]
MQFGIFDGVTGFHHALSTRADGVSTGEFASLNLGFHVGDEATAVRENRRLFAQNAGFDIERLVAAQQVHGANVRVISSTEAGSGALDWDSALPDCDALTTNEQGLPLLIQVADCAPVLLVDPQQRALAVVHAGWRGALAGAASNAIAAMHREFGTNPNDVLAAIGPCLNIDNLEVGEEVAQQVEAKNAAAVIRGSFAKPHLDLRAIIRDDLVSVNVALTNIEISPICTRERNDLFFSHRGQKGNAGRFGIVAWWS